MFKLSISNKPDERCNYTHAYMKTINTGISRTKWLHSFNALGKDWHSLVY